MHRIAALGINKDVRSTGAQQIHVRLERSNFFFGALNEAIPRKPTTNETQIKSTQNRKQRFGFARKFPAEFHTRKADIPDVRQTTLERRLAAKFRHIVI